MPKEPGDDLQGLFARVLRHQDALMAVIAAMTRDFEVAEELFQETVLEITRSAERYDDSRDFLRWAKGIARHMVLRHWAAQKRRPASIEQDALLAIADALQEEPDPDVWEREKSALRLCLTRLSEKHRRLFQSRYAQNLKGPALAEQVGLSAQSLGKTLMRIRGLLRECIRRRLGAAVT